MMILLYNLVDLGRAEMKVSLNSKNGERDRGYDTFINFIEKMKLGGRL